MNKSMRSWNDLEAGIVVEDAEVAVVVDGDADVPVSLAERYRAFTTGARGTTHTEMQFIIPLGITMSYLHSHSPMRSSRLAALASFKSKDARGYTTARVLHFFRFILIKEARRGGEATACLIS